MKKLAIASVLLASAVAAWSQTPVTQPAPQTQQVGLNNDPNETICVREQEIGSRLRARRVCRTRAEWDLIREQNRQVVDRYQTGSKQTSGQ